MLRSIAAAILVVSVPAWAAQAPAAFTGTDYSGRYECIGKDSHIGGFKGVVDMTLNAEQSTGKYGAYNFVLTLEDKSRSLKDYGVGVAQVVSTPEGKVSFTKYYYGPEYSGGGHGMEHCVKS